MAKVKRTITPEGQAFLNSLKAMTDATAKVGWMEGSNYPNGTPVAYVAAIQEFGYPPKNIPPHSFMRSTISENQVSWKTLIKSAALSMIKGNSTIGEVMEKLGSKAAGDVRKTISKITSPPLKESTIAARKNKRADKKTVGNLTKPLVDTGVLLNTLTNVTESK